MGHITPGIKDYPDETAYADGPGNGVTRADFLNYAVDYTIEFHPFIKHDLTPDSIRGYTHDNLTMYSDEEIEAVLAPVRKALRKRHR